MPRWVGPTFFVLFQVALVGTCLTIAIAFDIVERITSSQEAFSHTIAAGVVAAIVLMLVLFIVRQYAKSKVQRAAQEGLANAERLAQMLVGGERVDGSERRQAVEAAFGAAPRLLEFWILSSTYWRLFLGLGSVVGAAVLVAQLLTLTEQTRRLGEQNSLLTDQNQLVQLEANLAAISRRADYDQQQAARVYDEIASTISANTSASAIVVALERLPEAMVKPVTMVDPAWKPAPNRTEPEKQAVHPNLRPLAQLLLTYIKAPRPARGIEWSEEELKAVSDALVRSLHRVGFGNSIDVVEGQCVWHAIFDPNGVPRDDADHRLHKLRGDGAPTSVLAGRVPTRFFQFGADGTLGRSPGIDLRHIREDQLSDAKLPHADLRNAQLQDVELWYADLRGARIWGDARLQRTILSSADLRGAHLAGARMQGGDFTDADLRGAILSQAQLQGATLHRARLQGADLSFAQLQGARMAGAQLQGANLRGAELQGAHMRDVRLESADLSGGNLAPGQLDFLLDEFDEVLWRPTADAIGDLLGSQRNQFRLRVSIGTPAVSLLLPGTFLGGATFGRGVVIDPEGPSLDLLRSGRIDTTWWPDVPTAEAYLLERLGDESGSVVELLVERPTLLHGAKLDGVLIHPTAVADMTPDWTDPPPAQSFSQASQDISLMNEMILKSYRFPSWHELLKLSRDQAAEREKQASEAQSQP